MANYTEHVPLKGSERVVLPGAKAIGSANPDESLQVTVLLRSRAEAEDARTKTSRATASEKSAVESLLQKRAAERQHLTREQFLAQRGALEEDVQKVEEFAHEYGLSISDTNLAKGSVVLSGTVRQFSRAFNVELLNYSHGEGSYRGRSGSIHIPLELDGIVTAVIGLDNRPQARPHFRTHRPAITSHAQTTQPAGTFTPVQVAKLYDFPANANGTGQCIAIIELGGGFKSRDIKNYFKNTLNMTAPKVVAISVDGAHNKPTGDPNGPDGEVMLDIEVAGAVAPKSTLAVYFAPNTDQGFYNAIAAAVHDTRYNPSVISISWGGPESSWTQQSLTQFNTLLEDAATLGLTVCVASGDNGSTDGLTDGLQHVDFPASSPYSLACGGTNLTAAGGQYGSERVWNEMANQEGAGGGGVSDVFPKPAYQANVNVPVSVNPGNFVGRGVPDVCGDADPVTGYDVLVDGQASVIGGTSAVAPLWAGLTACINQLVGKRVGSMTSLVYSQVAPVANTFHDITNGNIGAFSAGPGWDPCTGFGSPIGSAIASALTGKAAAH
ncbi:MAG TPA: S53 family peptidase [Candidatus Acidoferrum sp.]|nr:S53 family peptidase [Candidatus Acidoferrum sp.]